MSEERDIGEGVTEPLQARHLNLSASKDIFTSIPQSPTMLANARQDVASLASTLSSSTGLCNRPHVTKQAPTKNADLQVQPIDLTRESYECRGHPHTIEDIIFENSFDKRIAKSLEDAKGEESFSVKGQTGTRAGRSPSRVNEALKELLDLRVAELSQKLTGVVADMIDSKVEARLAALEAQASQRSAHDFDVAKNIGEEICAMGSQIHMLNSRISKMNSRPSVRIEHVTALEDRVIALDSSLSELRCEYLERCLRAHQMEELLIALHSNIRDLRSTQSESQQGAMTNVAVDAAIADSSPRKQTGLSGAGMHSSVAGAPKGRQPRLETISEVPAGETGREEIDQEGEFSTSPENVSGDPCDGLAMMHDGSEDPPAHPDRSEGDAIAPELTVEPHTPDTKLMAGEEQGPLI
jgi:hypothetical protein